MRALYTKGTSICKLSKAFSEIFSEQTSPTRRHLIELVLSMLALNGYHSVKYNYEHFIREHSDFKLNSFYAVLKQAKIDLSDWTSALLRACLALREQYSSASQPIIFSVDDTVVEKDGSHFEGRAKLHDHANHNGSGYVEGHCFVCLMLHLPIQEDGKKEYLSVPLMYEMWDGENSKLKMATKLVEQVMKEIASSYPVILCCDSWYPKGEVLNLVDEFQNLTLVCNARCDTALYELPPKPTGKRGRPRVRGNRIPLDEFVPEEISGTDFLAGTREVRTNILGHRTVFAIVTKYKNGEGKRLFLCSRNPEELSFDEEYLSKRQAQAYRKAGKRFLPLAIYTERWDIEVSFYELKTFWSLTEYKVRSKEAVERLLNLIAITYTMMILLPYRYEKFSYLKGQSPQQVRFVLGEQIQQLGFLATFEELVKTYKNSSDLLDFLRSKPLSELRSA